MKTLSACFLSATCLIAPLTPLLAGPDWAHENSDLAVDPALKLGELDNGMRYMILKNAEPPGKVSLRLHIDAGSLMEAENQRGVAHFLEHMVFNGSKNFKPGELIPKMQRMGLGFGGHANAYTSFDETVYMLDLPNTEEDMLDLSFTIMRDFADGALLQKTEIDKERGVIIKELESRDSVESRMMEESFKQLFAGSRIPERFPIGLREVITGADRARFVEFYQNYYVPERMTFIVVGDINPEAVEKRIQEVFSSMRQPEQAGSDPQLGSVQAEGQKVVFVTDEEASSNEVELISMSPYQAQADLTATRLAELPLELANAMLNQRFSRLAKQEGAPFSKASAGYSEFFEAVALASLSLTANTPDDWAACLKAGEQELRRAIEHGFLPSELKEIKAELLSAAESQVKSASTRSSAGLAMALVQSLDERVFTRPEEDLRVLKLGLEKITPEVCQQALAAKWDFDEMELLISGKPALERPAEEVLETLKASQQETLSAPEAKALDAFAYDELPAAGKIAEEIAFDELEIRRVRFENGVVLNLKPTEFAKDSISLSARFGYGKLTLPQDKPGLDIYAGAIFNGGGLEAHSTEDLERLFAGKQVGAGLSIEDDHFALQGRTSPEDLELQLKLMRAMMLHPGYRPEAERQLDKQLPMLFEQLAHSPNGQLSTKVLPQLAGQDPRWRFPSMEQLKAYTPRDAQAWLDESLKQAPIELNVVGDFDPNELIQWVARSFGKLEPRQPLAELDRSVEMPVGGELESLEFDSKVDRGFSLAIWNLGEDEDYQVARRMIVLGEILSDRLRATIREEMGEAYSPMAQVEMSRGIDGMNYLMALSPGNRESSEKVALLLRDIGAKLAKEGVSQDELDRALKPLIADLDKTQRSNAYWLGSVLSGSTDQAWKLDAARNLKSDFANISAQDLSSLAKRYLEANRCQPIAIRPAARD